MLLTIVKGLRIFFLSHLHINIFFLFLLIHMQIFVTNSFLFTSFNNAFLNWKTPKCVNAEVICIGKFCFWFLFFPFMLHLSWEFLLKTFSSFKTPWWISYLKLRKQQLPCLNMNESSMLRLPESIEISVKAPGAARRYKVEFRRKLDMKCFRNVHATTSHISATCTSTASYFCIQFY